MDHDTFKSKHEKHGDNWALFVVFQQNLLIAQQLNNLMSVISNFVDKQSAFNVRQGAAIDSVVSSISGLTGDVQALNDKITELQNSAGTVTPEDQALLDQLEAQGDALSAKVEAAANALAALDQLTPPSAPANV